jgi:hypothetical protein
MAKSRRTRKGSRKGRKGSRRMRGGAEGAPVNYANPGPEALNLAQGRQFEENHRTYHGGAMAYGPYPGAVTEGPILPADLNASAKLLPLIDSFNYIKQFGPEADLKGGRRRKAARKGRKTRKTRKSSRKQRGGVLVRWGGARKSRGRKATRKGRKATRKGRSRRYRGGSLAEMRYPMSVGDESKMLIPASLQEQAGLNNEWELAKNPMAFAPNM